MPIYQNGLTGQRREVTLEESDWYEKNPPWYRADPPAPTLPYPPAETASKSSAEKD